MGLSTSCGGFVKKFLKWTGIVVAGLVGLVLVGIVLLYVISEMELRHRYEVAAAPALAIPDDAASIEEGRRLANLSGCTHCHSKDLSGAVPMDIPNVVRFVAPNLTELLPKYSDAQLITLLRHGVRPDGTGILFMPAEMTRHLDDADVSRLIAYLRTVPRAPGVTDKTEVRLIGRYIIASGKYVPPARAIANAGPETPSNLAAPAAHGRYLVMSLCTECHGQDLMGNPFAKSPPLLIAKGYPLEDFSRLLHDGRALGGRETKLMGSAARARFVLLTPEETAQIHEFLQSL
jgi:cytochrome c553